MRRLRSGGMFAFTVIWFGQLISMLGTGMTHFALLIWAWELTGEATALALTAVFSAVPTLLFSPIAGALVDRWNRKLMMIVGDLAAGLATVAIFLLFRAGNLQLWHLYMAAAFTSVFQAFQFPAYTASTALLIPKAQYTRASAMMSLAGYASSIGAPLFAGIVLSFSGFESILLIDIATFIIGISAVMMVRIPQPEKPKTDTEQPKSLWHEVIYGFRYIFSRRALVALLAMEFMFNLSESIGYPLIAPMILARTGSNEVLLGTVRAVMGAAGVLGGLWLTAWGGPKRRMRGVVIGLFLTGLLGDAFMGVARGLYGWIVAGFFLEFFIPLAIGSDQAIWQSKIPPALQGRVAATRRVIMETSVVAILVGGLLADHIFEPAMMPDGSLAPVFGWLVGTGPGAGMALLLILSGLLSALAGLLGYVFRPARDIESLLPDHGMAVEST
jgi:MFS transporter, DHA3 family, macrolide efflux protein